MPADAPHLFTQAAIHIGNPGNAALEAPSADHFPVALQDLLVRMIGGATFNRSGITISEVRQP